MKERESIGSYLMHLKGRYIVRCRQEIKIMEGTFEKGKEGHFSLFWGSKREMKMDWWTLSSYIECDLL